MILAPGQAKQVVVRPGSCQRSPVCGRISTIRLSKPHLASPGQVAKLGLARAARRKVYQQTASMKDCSIAGCFFWHETVKELFFFNGRKAWHHRYGYNYDYVACDDNSGKGVDVTVTFCGWRGPNPAYYGNGNHMSGQVHYKVYGFVKGFPISANYAMSMHNYGDGYVGYHSNDSP